MTTPVDNAIVQRWRSRLAIVIFSLTAVAVVSTVSAIAYDELGPEHPSMWLGLGCLVMGRASLPTAVTPIMRAQMAMTAAWLTAGVVLFVVVPVVLGRL